MLRRLLRPTPLRLLLLALVYLALLAGGLLGCASLTAGVDWDSHPTATPLPAYFVEVDDPSLFCGRYAGLKLLGCAVRDYANGVCTIYIERDSTAWTRTHELAHCAGLNHPAPRTAWSR